jgi:hypothetical protein
MHGRSSLPRDFIKKAGQKMTELISGYQIPADSNIGLLPIETRLENVPFPTSSAM